jgi:hypothetical protein
MSVERSARIYFKVTSHIFSSLEKYKRDKKSGMIVYVLAQIGR